MFWHSFLSFFYIDIESCSVLINVFLLGMWNRCLVMVVLLCGDILCWIIIQAQWEAFVVCLVSAKHHETKALVCRGTHLAGHKRILRCSNHGNWMWRDNVVDTCSQSSASKRGGLTAKGPLWMRVISSWFLITKSTKRHSADIFATDTSVFLNLSWFHPI